MSTPLVSVIIPTYNRAALVTRAIESVLQQTFSSHEVIVVDDASTDETAQMLSSRYGSKIVYIKKDINQGLAAARNTGIRAATGTLVAFLDDDDEWLPDKLALQVPLISPDAAAGLVYCGYTQVAEDGSIIRHIRPEKKGFILSDLLEDNYITGSASAVLIKREVLDKAGYFDETLTACEDWDLWIRIARQCPIDYADHILVIYKIHADNMHKDLFKMEQNTARVLDKHRSSMNEKIRSRRFYRHYISFAWQQYKAGNTEEFRRLLYSALDIEPVANDLFDYAGDIQKQEKTFFDVFAAYWERPENSAKQAIKRKAYALQHSLLAWVYYHQNKMPDFRRHMGRALAYSSARDSVRLLIPFLKSFFGKGISENLHEVRKNIFSG